MRTVPTNILSAMDDILAVFEARCADQSTLAELQALVEDRDRWPEAHTLFQKIRQKTLAASNRADALSEAQYLFEEICAKTLYNLSQPTAPFDADSAFWVLPLAIELGRRLGMKDGVEISALLKM